MAVSRFFVAWLACLLLAGASGAAANRPPMLAAIGDQTVTVGQTLSIQLTAFDPEKLPVVYSAQRLPPGATLDPVRGLFLWTPTIDQLGYFNVTFSAADTGQPPLSASETIKIKVVFVTRRVDKSWGLGTGGETTVLETSSPADLLPVVSKIEIDGQTYDPSQKDLYASTNPTIKIELASPYNIDQTGLSVMLDGQPISIASIDNVQTFGNQNSVLSLTLRVTLNNLAKGSYVMAVSAGNSLGLKAETITFSVAGLRLTGSPLSFPNPFNPAAGNPVILQYNLTEAADIDILLFSNTGQVMKRLLIFKGDEGGRQGLNKVSWDGRTDLGGLIGNGIYVAAIMDRSEHKVLGKLKLTVFN